MNGKAGAPRRSRGGIETLPSGSLRVKVYTGRDPLTGQRHYVTETFPPGRTAQRDAERAMTRILNEVNEKRNPRTRATVNKLMDRYLEVLQVETTTRATYEGYVRNHIRPMLGSLQVGSLDGELLDSFYAQLRLCRAHCRGRKYVEHRVEGEHECNKRCRPHTCRPPSDSSIRQIHGILSGACHRAVRWHWIGTNPIDQTEPLASAHPDPQPPSPEQAARIANEAWQDLDWGMLVWLTLMTGARRGELCALRWDRLDFARGVLTIRTSIAQIGARTWEKDIKTHQQRRITLDEQTLSLLQAYLKRCIDRAAELGIELPEDARIFSGSVDGRTWLKPDSVGQRYTRMCARLGWDMNIHQLRHFSATELIGGGVDVRTVAGRLGHGGGGSTTLRVYTAWISEADQRAAGKLAGRMPALPAGLENGTLVAPDRTVPPEDASPYQRIATDLRAANTCGALLAGDELPTVADLAKRYEVAPSTAHTCHRGVERGRARDGQQGTSRGRR